MDWSISGIMADLRVNWKSKIRLFRIHMFAFALFLTGLLTVVDPYVLQTLFPDRWGSVVWIGYGVLAWLLRKATDHPILVSTTYSGEQAVTEPDEPVPAPKPDDVDLHRLDDDGAPHGHVDVGVSER